MTTYYVDFTNGNDADPGSEAEPWKTVNKAATTAVAGDIVIYEDDTYPVGAGQTTWNSGNAGSYITHMARNSRQVIWKRSANGRVVGLATDDDYLWFEGIVFDGDETSGGWTGSWCVHLDGSDYIRFIDCETQDTETWCFYLTGGTTNIVFDGCEIHMDHWIADPTGVDGILAHGAGIANITVKNCTFYSIDHVACYFNSGTNTVVKDNTIYNTGSHGVQFGSPGAGNGWGLDGKITGNVIHDTKNFGTTSGDKCGIYITGGDVDAVVIQRNTIFDTDWHCIQVGANVVGPIDVYNNTMRNWNKTASATGAAIQLNDGSAGIAVACKNNCAAAVESSGVVFRVSGADMNAGLDADYNTWHSESGATDDFYRNGTAYGTFAAYQAAPFEANSRDDDPDFADVSSDDFTLEATSPCIDDGVYESPVDYYFGSAPDMGAHEYTGDLGAETIQVIIWRSNGTGDGDDGDLMAKATVGAVTRVTTLSDYSAL